MNIVAMLGKVAEEPEYSDSGGMRCCRFVLAIDTVLADEPELFVILAFDRPARLCERYMSVGDRVIIEGRVSPTLEANVVAKKVERIGRVE